jgi:MFS superfamily sulfate permease-like transporter
MAGYLIAVIALALPLSVGAAGVARPRIVIGLGAVMAIGWAVALVAGRAQDGQGHHIVPVWFLASLVAILYLLWCGGLWLGLRLRNARTR